MNKQTLLALLILGNIATAQTTNEALAEKLKERRNKTRVEYDFYSQRKLSQLSSKDNANPLTIDSLKTQLQQEKSKVAFFFEGRPYFLELKDTDQISNANVDFIQNGNIDGLNNSFNGEGIKVAVFDGGRAYEKHDDFGGENSTRISNKESSSVPYDSHATAVTGMIGAQGHTLTYSDGTVAGNTKGMMPLATFDNYSFDDTILEGETEEKDVHQKILGTLPNISNHSYGATNGWIYRSASPTNLGEGWYWNGLYDPDAREYISLEGTYLWSDQEYDDIVYNNPSVIILKAAGNEYGDGPSAEETKFYTNGRNYATFDNATDNIPPNSCAGGYDCISFGSLAKNIIVVGATEKISTNDGRYTQSRDVVKASYSSAGPRDDGGIKPDIAGVGSDIIYPSTTSEGAVRWGLGSGTSYSTPQVTGIIGLWTEINRTLFNQDFNAASAKTLLIHSAQEAGSIGPDAWYGWGFADAKAGAELLVKKANNEIIFEDKSLQNGTTDEILVETDGKQPIKVSISWIDPSFKNLPTTYAEANNNRTSTLVNDLDLRITNTITGEIFYPWKLDANNPMAPAHKGDNMVDNVEQVVIDTPIAGTYKIEVSHKGTLVDNDGRATGSQNYSILATGYTQIASDNSGNEGIFVDESKIISPTLITRDSNKLITIYHPYKQIENVSVYDSTGRLVFSDNINAEISQVDFSKFDEGVYIINAKFNDGFIKKSKILKR